MDNWTRRTRMIICSTIAYPLGKTSKVIKKFSFQYFEKKNPILNIFDISAFSMVTVGALSIERCSEEAADANNTSLVTTSEANLTSQNYTIFDYMSAGAGNICLDILVF